MQKSIGERRSGKALITAVAISSMSLALAGVSPSYAINSAVSSESMYTTGVDAFGGSYGSPGGSGSEEWEVVLNSPAGEGDSSISGVIWSEGYPNMVKDSEDFGIPGVTVTLEGEDANGEAVNLVDVTDNNGIYYFTKLKPGDYTITISPTGEYQHFIGAPDENPLPEYTVISGVDYNGQATVSLHEGEKKEINAGFFSQLMENSWVEGVLWYDANEDGIRDDNEPFIPEAAVVVTGTGQDNLGQTYNTHTDQRGRYSIDVPEGEYNVAFFQNQFTTQPLEYTLMKQGNDPLYDSDADPSTGGIDVVSTNGSIVRDADAGVIIEDLFPVDVYGSVWDDIYEGWQGGYYHEYEDKMPNIEVRLEGFEAITGDPVSLTTQTDSRGDFQFNEIPMGRYNLIFVSPEGYGNFPPSRRNLNRPSNSVFAYGEGIGYTPLNLVSGYEYNLITNAAMRSVMEMEIGTTVWFDENENGVREESEAIIPGAKVTLNGVNILGEEIRLETETDESGKYTFSVKSGDYTVNVTPPLGYASFTERGVGDDGIIDSDFNEEGEARVIINYGDDRLNIDAGLLAAPPVSTVGNFIWSDTNGNGVQDAGETGVQGVGVTLSGTSDDKDVVNASLVSDENGMYTIPDLRPGKYDMSFTLPDGYIGFSPMMAGGNSSLDSNVDEEGKYSVTVAEGVDDLTIDVGLLPESPANLSIGGMVWLDENKNGLQDPQEGGVGDVRVNLKGTNIDGENIEETTLTDTSGKHLFSQLKEGKYIVKFITPEDETFAGFTQQYAGSDTKIDSNVNSLGVTEVELTGETANMDVDAGVLPPEVDSIVSTLVWFDENLDGIMGQNEPRVPNVVAMLTGVSEDGVQVELSCLSDGDGVCVFEGVPAGNYQVKFSLPQDYDNFTHQDLGDRTNIGSDVTREGVVDVEVKGDGGDVSVVAGVAKDEVVPTPTPTQVTVTPTPQPTETIVETSPPIVTKTSPAVGVTKENKQRVPEHKTVTSTREVRVVESYDEVEIESGEISAGSSLWLAILGVILSSSGVALLLLRRKRRTS